MTSSSLPEWRPLRTSIDLYHEKDRTPWYHRLAATVSTMVLLMGFLVFPFASMQAPNSTFTSSSAQIGAFILIFLAYIVSTILSLVTKSWLFQLDLLYIPHLTSSVLALISIICALAAHNGILSTSTPSARHAIAALTLSIMSMFVYTILSLLTYRKVYIVRARDAMHRKVGSSTPVCLPETEQQRKQLLRLLLQQEDEKKEGVETGTQHTFMIDWPGNGDNQSQRASPGMVRFLTTLGGSTRHASQRSSMPGPPADHLTGGIERVSSVIQDEQSVTGSGSAGLTRLRPVAYVIPQSEIVRYASPIEPPSAAPSYCEHAHPSLNISTRLPQLQENGYPIEKPYVYSIPISKELQPVGQVQYRMAEPGARYASDWQNQTRRAETGQADWG